MVSTYQVPGGDGSAEIEVKRSRFRCAVVRAEDEAAARALVDRCRAAFPDARHHCSAFVIGPTAALERCSDDGEPSGTAGAPMLEVLRGQGLSDVAAVVTRWFGGVLLGTGGLSRAYADTVRAALATVPVRTRTLQQVVEVQVGHADAGRLEHELRLAGATIQDVRYADRATFRVAVAEPGLGAVRARVAVVTGGTSSLLPVGSQWVDQ